VALTNPDDIRPVLQSFGNAPIPEEWAKREAAMNEQHRLQWMAEQEKKPTKRNLGSLLRGGGQEIEGPPPTYLEQMRRHVRETFAQEHEAMKVQQDQMLKDMESQKEKMKDMKMTVWELMSQVSSVSGREREIDCMNSRFLDHRVNLWYRHLNSLKSSLVKNDRSHAPPFYSRW
jgi:import inner membrane translocase subunit TIM50